MTTIKDQEIKRATLELETKRAAIEREFRRQSFERMVMHAHEQARINKQVKTVLHILFCIMHPFMSWRFYRRMKRSKIEAHNYVVAAINQAMSISEFMLTVAFVVNRQRVPFESAVDYYIPRFFKGIDKLF